MPRQFLSRETKNIILDLQFCCLKEKSFVFKFVCLLLCLDILFCYNRGYFKFKVELKLELCVSNLTPVEFLKIRIKKNYKRKKERKKEIAKNVRLATTMHSHDDLKR